MSEFIFPPISFTTLYGEKHKVGITPEWGVILDTIPSDQYLAPAGVMILGFARSLDLVVPREEFYKIVTTAYDEAVGNGALVVPEINEYRSGTNLGDRLGRLIGPQSSPFRTNVQKFSLGVSKWLLIAKNPADEKAVRKIIEKSDMSTNNKEGLLLAYTNRIAFNLRNTELAQAKPKKARTKIGPTPGYLLRLSEGITEVPTSASRKVAEQDKKSNEGKIEEPKKPKETNNKVGPSHIDRADVVKVTGGHMLDAKSGSVFSQRALVNELGINPSDESRVRQAILVLQHAGYLKIRMDSEAITYVRTTLRRPST